MVVLNCGNKRYIRLWLVLILLSSALLLIWRNLQQAQMLSRAPELGSLIGVPPDLPADSYEEYVELPGIARREDSPRTRDLQLLLKCRNRSLRFQRLQHGDYWLLQNLVIGRKSRHVGCAETVTYTTNGDFTFFDNLETVVSRWRAPVSFAIHAPGYDMNTALDAIRYVRNCLPGSEVIKDWVTFHVYFPNRHMPEYVPYGEHRALGQPYACTLANGTQVPPPYALVPRSESYKARANLSYPINVGRNIARQAATTHFVFACDIELYPSLGFVDQFLDMVARNHSVLALDPKQPRRVYPLPVFEVESGAPVPKDKAELLALFGSQRAQVFHLKLCPTCHMIPGQKEWLNQTSREGERLHVFSHAVRRNKFRAWEPFYVSDNTEPFFDERVTWEGQSNKRIQNYAMCLLGYEYHVLSPAFLVHSPGIKKFTKSDSVRLKLAKDMTKFIKDKIEPEYRVLFGRNSACKT
ncbi:beta-1,4-glucuronyltransferase 1 [Drosophila ficusphila]|uniref:beta-1,4-glucuronyltransferase 1 n=1 Tax=Drosophila ficusphila TaxID=30025 RepID=UPI0007E5FD79|nr:beta-1,4-glucuronyltransferase 1 [Drosophila ficusphila]XP_017050655.1 beta-1,4-glucuronyltransferase 1 [Drosophila ficusphila]XP_017050656.1 beta-1,4-glucuronyltransferase 1 [Drosophila ficusphila]